LASWSRLRLWLRCAAGLWLCTAVSITLGASASASSSLPILPSEGQISLRGHALYQKHREIGLSFTRLQMNYTHDVTVKIHCSGCQPGKPSTRGFVTEHRMRGERIPNDATLYIEITRRNWIGLYIQIRHAGREYTKETVFCLYPGHKHRKCPSQPPATPAKTTNPTPSTTIPPLPSTTIEHRQPAETEAEERTEREQREAKEDQLITSFDGTRGDLAPYEGAFTSAEQQFTAASNRITYAGVTIANPALPAGQSSDKATIRICEDPKCAGAVLASTETVVDNYGLSSVTFKGELAVVEDQTYYLEWTPPVNAHGSQWLTFWQSGSPDISGSRQLEAVVRGYNREEGPEYPFKAEIPSYLGSQAPPAPYSGAFSSAYQAFSANSNRITRLGVVVGNPKLARGAVGPEKIRMSLCSVPECTDGSLATAERYIVNYGVTETSIPPVAVMPGATYFLTWQAPEAIEGERWVGFWLGTGPSPDEATSMQAFVKGYDEGYLRFTPFYFVEQPEEAHSIETFKNYEEASENGPNIRPLESVEVSCKVFAPQVEWSEPEGYWYRIHSPPWNDEYYAAANEFRNTTGSGEAIPTDPNVPAC
jgi:hypothetical protein